MLKHRTAKISIATDFCGSPFSTVVSHKWCVPTAVAGFVSSWWHQLEVAPSGVEQLVAPVARGGWGATRGGLALLGVVPYYYPIIHMTY